MKRYEFLDCLRGLAALAVVLYHLTVVRLADPLMPQGYLAVDFFFVLSGFVIANAYEYALRSGRCTLSSYICKRVIRLYPLAFAGAVFGLSVLLLKYLFFPAKCDPLSEIFVSAVLNMTLLPTFWGRAGSEHLLFPANGPLWSLFFELLINVVWAIGFARRSIASLFLVLTASALFLVSEIHTAGTGNLGMNRATFCGGLARVTFGFTAGVLIYRFRSSIRVPQIAAGNWILVACLSIIMTFPATIFFRQEHYDLVCAVIIMPVIVLAGISQDSLGRVGRLSGELSYPLYALHYPVLSIVSGLHQTELSWMAPYKLSVMAVVMSLLASWLALTLYDKPLHGFLERIIMFRASAADGTFTDNRKRRAISSAGQSDMRPQLE